MALSDLLEGRRRWQTRMAEQLLEFVMEEGEIAVC
ncbi:hypothetical protein M877_21470 [Streptomyces niveus NCIMB 11891]|nr:hypothetical protein M877_21470 [Streptomyces niveus NCIMB 11891]